MSDRGRNSWRALVVALGVDNIGSGLFLPLAVVYITTVVGVPLALAGLLVTLGTLVGLAAPPLAGSLADRHGPRSVVVASQVLQALGMALYLLATGPVTVCVAAALVAAGTQTFYSAVFALIADVAPPGPKDHTFAVVEMIRSAMFGVGALVGALLVSTLDAGGLRTAVGVNGLSFLVTGLLLVVLVRPEPRVAVAASADGEGDQPPAVVVGDVLDRRVLANRPYLALIAAAGLLSLPSDLLLAGSAVYLRELDPGAVWAAGASVAVLTASIALLNRAVVRRTIGWRRTTAMAAGGWCFAGWAALSAVAIWLPRGWVGPWALGSVVLLAAGSLLFGTRVNVLAEAAAPPASRGRHLAAFQYAFTVAGLLAPLLVSTLAMRLWLPWLLVGIAAVVGALAVPVLGRHLPASSIRPAR